jgi:hypothetical protein
MEREPNIHHHSLNAVIILAEVELQQFSLLWGTLMTVLNDS